MTQLSDRFSRPSLPAKGSKTSIEFISTHGQQPNRTNPFQTSDLDTLSPQAETNPQTSVALDDLVFFDKNGGVKWQDICTFVLIPGAVGGAGRWVRQEVKLQSQPAPPIPSNIWSSTGFYYGIVLGLIAALIGNFVLARLILNIDKNKLTYLGLSLVFGMFSSTVFAIGGQTVFSAEAKIDKNQAGATASNVPEVKEKAIESNQTIAEQSTDAKVKEDAIEASEVIAIGSDDSAVQEKALKASESIATSSDDLAVQEEALEASEAIATSSTYDGVKQEAIATTQSIALQSENTNIQAQAIDTTVAIFEATTEPDTQIAAIHSISDLAVNSLEQTADLTVYQEALDALGQIDVERLEPGVIAEITAAETTIQETISSSD